MDSLFYFVFMKYVAPHAKYFLINENLKAKEIDETTKIERGQYVLRATYLKSTPRDYRYYLNELLDEKGNPIENNSIQYKSIEFKIMPEEWWTKAHYITNNHRGICIQIEAKDHLGELRTVSIGNNRHDEDSVTEVLNYVVLLDKVRSHDAVTELTKAQIKIDELHKKIRKDYEKFQELKQKYLKAISKK